uniref:Zinc finger and BTB domain containing 22a n=1 Tax=Paramormyrops kingsleyae TaxID=1676925 RepID=A0A3B3Q5Z1_9TELE
MPSSELPVSFPSVRTAVLDSLNRQREEGRLCDLSIQVQGQVFRAHRCVMAASSPYFHDQVLLKNVTTVSLPSVMDPLVFESVLSSAYTGHLSIVRDDIVNYVTVASFLQMWHIVDKCTEILKRPRALGGAQSHGGNTHNAPSRQQSPSSTDCLYTERDNGAGPGPPARMQWQASPWLQQGSRPMEREEDYRREEEEDEEEEEEVDFGRFADEDGTGQVSQRPLVPASPSDDNEYHLGPPELGWPPLNIATQGQGGATAPGNSRHIPPSSAPFPPSSSPPIPSSSSSSSSLSIAGTSYSGKVHFCHCGKAYTLKSMRDRHVKMQHLNLRPFACPVCAKTFKMKHHLTKHLKTHGGLRPYECGLCGKKVIWRDSFLRHQALSVPRWCSCCHTFF